MSDIKTGAVTQCNTFNHLFQLWSSSLVSITGTVSVRSRPAGYCGGGEGGGGIRRLGGWEGGGGRDKTG